MSVVITFTLLEPYKLVQRNKILKNEETVYNTHRLFRVFE